MILNKAQAQEVCNAMIALNNINARIEVIIPIENSTERIQIKEDAYGKISIEFLLANWKQKELYENQSAFFGAYGI